MGHADALRFDPDENVDGQTAVGVLEAIESIGITLTWTSLEGTPQTTLGLGLEPSGEPITLGLGGENNCDGLVDPCPQGYTIPIVADITTEDGILDVAEQVATIEEQIVAPTVLDVVVSVEDIGGTFGEQVFADGRGPLEFDTATFSFRFDGLESLSQFSIVADSGALLAVGTME